MAATSRRTKLGSILWGLGVAAVPIFFYAAIAGPKLISFRSRARQSQASSDLRNLSRAMQHYREEHEAFEADVHKVGWQPEGIDYLYFVSDAAPLNPSANAANLPTQTACSITSGKDEDGRELRVGVTRTAFIALAVSRDQDRGNFDCWSVASMARTAASGQRIPAGEPFHESEPQYGGRTN